MRVTCPDCFASAKVPAAAEGKKVRCKACGGVFRAEADAEPPPPPPSRRRGAGPREAKAKRGSRGRSAPPAQVAVIARRAGIVAAATCGGLALLAWAFYGLSRMGGGAAGFVEGAGPVFTGLFFLALFGTVAAAVVVVAGAAGTKGGRGAAAGLGGALLAVVVVAFLLHPAHWTPVIEAAATAGKQASRGRTDASYNTRIGRQNLSDLWTGKRSEPDFTRTPGALRPPPDGEEERRGAQATLDRVAAWDGSPVAGYTVTRTVGGQTETFEPNVGPQVGGRWGVMMMGSDLALPLAYPVRGLRVRRARRDGRVAVAEVVPLRGSDEIGDELPGEEAAKAPAGYKLGGADVAFGSYVYALRPLWAPDGAPAGDAAAAGSIREGAWLGEPGSHAVARLLPPPGAYFYGFSGSGRGLVDGSAVAYVPEPPPVAPPPTSAERLGPLAAFELWPWGRGADVEEKPKAAPTGSRTTVRSRDVRAAAD